MRAVLLLCVAWAAFAQSTGTISGTVSDRSSAPIANVALQAKNNVTGATRSVQSDSSGKYALTDLPPGAYQFIAAAPGLAPFIQLNFKVESGQTAHLDIHLDDLAIEYVR